MHENDEAQKSNKSLGTCFGTYVRLKLDQEINHEIIFHSQAFPQRHLTRPVIIAYAQGISEGNI